MREGRPSRTAQHNALFRALEARRPPASRVADDPLAVHFLPPKFRLLAELARFPPVLRLIEEVIDRRWPGPRSGVVVRTRLLDETISRCLSDVDQVLILGAGFDTRAYRLPAMDGVRVFEVDHPATQSVKKRIVLRAICRTPEHVTFVPVEFGRDNLSRSLSAAGLASAGRTLVLWEGVTNYLTAEAVDATFRFIASVVAPCSPVLFTYIDRSILDDSAAFEGASESSKHVERVGEPYTFGFDPSEVPAYLTDRGLDLVWDMAVPEAALRYYAEGGQPRGHAWYHVVEARRS
jgi:methyltransferase (TIGR00027 family)